MDLRNAAANETSRIELTDGVGNSLLDDAGNQPAIVVYGPGSKEYTAAVAARNNRTMDRLRKKGKSDLTPEQQLADHAAFLSACTHSMEGVERDGLTGAALHKATYSDPSIGFIAEQVSMHLGDWGNFTKPVQKP